MATKDEIEAENAELRARIAELEAAAPDPAADPATDRPAPQRPDYGLSAGERADLEQHGVAVSPFTGETLTATLEGVIPLTAEAIDRDAKETAKIRAARAESADDVAPAADL